MGGGGAQLDLSPQMDGRSLLVRVRTEPRIFVIGNENELGTMG
jgi:hypothetical protein